MLVRVCGVDKEVKKYKYIYFTKYIYFIKLCFYSFFSDIIKLITIN